MKRRALLLGAAALLAGACAAPPTPPAADLTKIDRLIGLMSRRLGVSEDVARAKWNSKAPVEDLAREQVVIAGGRAQAAKAGLDPEFAARFFAAQIEASKSVQSALLARWESERRPPFPKVPDLGRDIRPQLDRLTGELMAALAAARPLLASPEDRQWFEARARHEFEGWPGGARTASDALAWLKTTPTEGRSK